MLDLFRPKTTARGLEHHAGVELEDLLKIVPADQLVDRRLTMFAADLGQDQPGGVAVIAPTELDLDGDQFAGPVSVMTISSST